LKDHEVNKITFGDWPMPEAFLLELGRIAAMWASLENVINLTLTKLCGLEVCDPRGVILFEHLSMPQKLDTLGALGDQLAQRYTNLKDLPGAIAKIRSAQKLRNDYIHNSLTYSAEEDCLEMPVGSARGKLKADVRKVHKVDLKRAVVEISVAQRHLWRVVFQREIPHPWERPA
jgi:hypothetical protein